jgi:Putative collagen-binding domain of a collagenase
MLCFPWPAAAAGHFWLTYFRAWIAQPTNHCAASASSTSPLVAPGPRLALADGELVSTKHCLANPGQEYLVYLPQGGETTVDLSTAPGAFRVEWMNPSDGTTSAGQTITGGAKRTLKAPFNGDATLYVRKVD